MLISTGALFFCYTTQRFLFVLRNPRSSHGNTWSLVGGKIDPGELTISGLYREITEEIGFIPKIIKSVPLDAYESRDQHFKYYTWLMITDKEFIPDLNDENIGYAWVGFDGWPKPLHPGLYASFKENTIRAKITNLINLDIDNLFNNQI